MIQTNRLFLQRESVNEIELSIKRDQMGSENVKTGVNGAEVPPSSSSMAVPPPDYATPDLTPV